MKTETIQIDPARVEVEKIHLIARVIRQAGVIAYPTDTFYGLGANSFSEKAVGRIFKIKKRPVERALPVIVADMEMARALVLAPPPVFEELASLFWPGPLTLILKAAASLPDNLVGPRKTIGIRIPAVPWLRELVREASCPLVATSANISGQREIASAAEVVRLFKGKVECIVDGGDRPARLASTVLDLTSGKPRLVREGALPLEKLKKYLTD